MKLQKPKSLLNPNPGIECPDCGAERIGQTKGERFCKECGFIIQKHHIQTEETRKFSKDESVERSRTGNSISFNSPDQGMATKIGHSGELNKMTDKKAVQYHRLRKWQRRREGKARLVKQKLRVLERYSDVYNLPENVKDESGRLVRKAQEEGIFEGRKIEDVVLAIIHLVSREMGVPLTIGELVGSEDQAEKKKVQRAYRQLYRELDKSYSPVRPSDLIPRYASYLDVSTDVRMKAVKIAKRTEETAELSGRSPSVVTASCLYIASILEEEDLKQAELSEMFGVSEVGIRNSYQDILQALDLEDKFEEIRTYR